MKKSDFIKLFKLARSKHQFIFTLILLLVGSILFGQPTKTITIEGESLWRNQGYGVANHTFDIETYIVDITMSFEVDPDPTTSACSNSYYTTNNLTVYRSDEDEPTNTIKIRPYSVNNEGDYDNGVTTLDLSAISAHLAGTTYFEDRTPTDDAPYRYISADADYDHDVDEDDIDQIRDLILNVRTDLDRNSWEWVHKDEVEQKEEDFEEDPYSFVIDYNWPGSEGIIISGVTTNEIEADNDKYFTFRTTKIGDIIANGGTTSINTWVCGSGSYFSSSGLETRSSRSHYNQKISKGSVVKVGVFLDRSEDIRTIEYSIGLLQSDFSIFDVEFIGDFDPYWNYNMSNQSLIVLDYNLDITPVNVSNGKIMEFKLKALQDINMSDDPIKWSTSRPVEISRMDESVMDADIWIEILDVNPEEFQVYQSPDYNKINLLVDSPLDQTIEVNLYDANSAHISSKILYLNKGFNSISFDNNLSSGMYFLHIVAPDENEYTKKVVINH